MEPKKPIATWPINLVQAVDAEYFPLPINEEEESVMISIMREHLTSRECDILLLRFREEKTLLMVGKVFKVGTERIRQIEAKAIRKLRHPKFIEKLKRRLYPTPYEEIECLKKQIEEKKRLVAELARLDDILDHPEQHKEEIDEIRQEEAKKAEVTLLTLDLSVRPFNALARRLSYVNGRKWKTPEEITIDDILNLFRTGEILEVRNLGKKSIGEIITKIKALGYEIPEREQKGE